MKKSSAIVCSVRNPNKKTEMRLLDLASRIGYATGSLPSTIIIIESDSRRKYNFSLLNSVSTVIHLDLGPLSERYPSKIERIAICRNKYMDLLDNLQNHPEVIVVVDPDAGNFRSLDMSSAFRAVKLWDGVFANWRPIYYDILALRSPGWSENDYRNTGKSKSNDFLGLKLLQWRIAISRMRRIDRNSPPVKVSSAFGGLAIYQYDKVRSLRYEPTKFDGITECEHVSFNMNLASRGGKLAILPSLCLRGLNKHIAAYYLSRLMILGKHS